MKAYYQNGPVTIYHGDCRELSLENISAIVTDPPYELGFMGKTWDSQGVSFQKETWEILRQMCLPGSPLLSFGGSRTQHRIAVAIEDAGWEIRDTLMWVYGSGFPKSLDVSRAIDYDACREQLTERLGRAPSKEELKAEWANWRQVVGTRHRNVRPFDDGNGWNANNTTGDFEYKAPATPEAQLWEGYGTALKPAYEPIILAMNPLDGTFANNALKHKVAGLNIDGTRIEYQGEADKAEAHYNALGMERLAKPYGEKLGTSFEGGWRKHKPTLPKGRFPANFMHDGSQMVLALFPNSKSEGGRSGHTAAYSGGYKREYYGDMKPGYGDNGSAARFFYCAKASKAERNAGCEGLPEVATGIGDERPSGQSMQRLDGRPARQARNTHPTVKPLALMEYLVKLVKYPEYNLILDPFMGSGTTLLACIRLGIPCIGIDSDEQSCEIAARRCAKELE